MIKIKKLHDKAMVSYQSGSAGLDIHAIEPIIVPKKSWVVVPTGIAIDPRGIVPAFLREDGFIASIDVFSRSGSSAKFGIEKGAGLIDENYRGEIKIVVHNHSDVDYPIFKGDKFAQLTFRIAKDPFYHEFVEELEDSNRGEAGFGSSGN